MIPEGEFQPDGPLKPQRPWWFTTLLVVLVLPAFGLPWMLVSAPAGSILMTLIKLFPVYLVGSAFAAWKVYPARRDLAWILVALMILTSSALFVYP